MWEVSMNLAASTPAWKTPVKMFQKRAICKMWQLKLWAVYVLKIQNQVWWKGHCSGNLAESLTKGINAPRGRDTFPVSICSDPRMPKIPEIQSCFLFFVGFMIRAFQEKIQPNKCVGSTGTPKKKVAFWAFQLFEKFCPPLLSPNDLGYQKKRESFFVQRRIFWLFEGSSCKNIVISCKDAIHPLDDITLESPTHKQDWSFIQRQNSISSVYLEGFADANKKPQKKK